MTDAKLADRNAIADASSVLRRMKC
jgi:hypothetical protein